MNCAQNIYKNKNFDGFDDLEWDELEGLAEETGQNSKKLTIEDLTKEEAERLYYEKRLSFTKIAKMYGTYKQAIYRKCLKFNIVPRAAGENKKAWIEKNILEKLYFKENKSLKEIGEIFDLHHEIVSDILKRHGLKTKTPGEKSHENAKKLPEEEIAYLYTDKKMSARQISEKFNVKQDTILRRLKNNNIKIKNCSDYSKGLTELSLKIRKNKKNIDLRKEIFQRDNYTCTNPECGIRGGNLDIDHIIPFSLILEKNNIDSIEKAMLCEQLWDKNNLRTLCRKCHTKTDTWGEKCRLYKKEYLKLNG